MDSLQNRLIFAVSILRDNDNSARLILSDLLESEGEVDLAILTRTKRKSWPKRLDAVIGVLPHMLFLKITCDFVGKSLRSLPSVRMDYPTANTESLDLLAHAVEEVSAWAEGKREDSALDRATRGIASVSHWQFGIANIHPLMQSLHLAVCSSRIARGEETHHRNHVDGARSKCRKAIKAAREITKRHPKGNFTIKELREWQFAHVISVLESEIENSRQVTDDHLYGW